MTESYCAMFDHATMECSRAARVVTYPYTIDNGSGERLTFTGVTQGPSGERLGADGVAQPGAGPPMHVHHRQNEAARVVRGMMGHQVRGGPPRFAGPGDLVVWPAGTPHKWWNAGSDELHMTGWCSPPDNIEFFLGALFASTKENGGARPALFDVAFLLSRYRTEFGMLEMPAVVRVIIPFLYVLGRVLGKYRKFSDAPAPISYDRPKPAPERERPESDSGVERIVDNRVFLLGLDELYRHAMKTHERGELLACAHGVATALNVRPANVPIEGYYADDADLTAYFRLIRSLQVVPLDRAPEVESSPEFRRLLAVTSSPIFGMPVREYLLPVGRDPLSEALRSAQLEGEWTVPRLTAAAARVARETDDYSLVGLASRAEDSVVLASLRESVVLYAEMELGAVAVPRYVWRVDPELSAAAERFVNTFNALFGEALPPPTEEYAEIFADAASRSSIVGRCVRLGQDRESPTRYYHWAVTRGSDQQLIVDEFWSPEIWTTERYRRDRSSRARERSSLTRRRV